MASQIDLDQGGTFRPFQRRWMGYSIGWMNMPEAVLYVRTDGTTNIRLGTTMVIVNMVGTGAVITDHLGNPITDQYGNPITS